MDYINGIWQVVLLYLVNCKLCGCYGIACAGRIIVESNVVRLGTNLTVQCQSDTVQCGRLFAIDFNEETIFKKINCSFVKTEIVINNPKSWVYCKVKEYETWRTVCGQDLTAGYPPAKPTKFNCVTHRHSVYVNCSMATTETHLSTKYTVTFEHKWTSQSLQYEMKNGHVSIPRSVFNDTLTYDVHVMGRNALGEANSTFTFSVFNIVIPSTPEITKVEFKNGSFSPTIHWKSSDDSLKPSIRFRSVHNNQEWVLGKVTELKHGPILMQQSLEPFKSYELEMRVCLNSTNCSMWSYPFNITCPGKAPSHKLDVWRIIKKNDAHGLQDVAVLWKPYESEDYRGDLLQYTLSYKENGKVQEVNCTAHVTHHTLRLPLDVAEINVSAVTSTGSSPSAPVSLTYTGKPAPIITYLGGAPGGSVRLDWDLSRYREDVKRIMGFVVQWQQSPVHLQWKRIAKDCNYTFLEGMQAGILYNISLYIEEASGLSDPAFGRVYSKEEKPLTGPNVSILYSVGEKHFLIRWEELEQEKRRGFITKYTIYFQRHTDKKLIQNSTLPYTLPRSLNWKPQDPQESFSILVSAWNSAGEGPKGKAATCYSDRRMTCGKILSDYTTDRMVAGFCLVAAVPIVILANLMFLKCVRQRMVKMCMSMGVTWLFENLPKFDNSNAIQLLKDESYLPWEPLPGDSDPPLTPIEEVNPSWERQDSYPTVIHEDVPETPVVRQSCIECPYKPQRTEGAYETTEEEVKEDEDQFPLLISPLHLPYDFSWDLSTICMQPGSLNSILPMDGSLGSLSVLESFISTPQTTSENYGVKENERNVETRNIVRSSFISQTVIPNDLESCLLNSSPYSPQGGCFHFSMPEED